MRRWWPRVLALLTVLALTAACGGEPPGRTRAADNPAAQGRPNIVVVMVDDMAMNLLPFMPNVQRMQREGVSLPNNFTTDSLCCPSRASTLTGRFPHSTGVFTNTAPDGGFGVFHRRGGENDTIGTRLQAAGYRTGLMGKYLNGYQPGKTVGGTENYVPPGWDDWQVAGKGYAGFNYAMNSNGRVAHHGGKPEDYLTDVLSAKASDFIGSSASQGKPFYLQLATFTPHAPYTPAPRHAAAFPGLTAPRGPAFNQPPTNVAWLADRPPLRPKQTAKIDQDFRKRAQSMLAIDEMIGSVQRNLQERGLANNTYLVFTSDNGYHMGQYRLASGKQTAFDTDINVPLVITGPRLHRGAASPAMAENIDLAPTFVELATGTAPSNVDGHSLAPVLYGPPPADWRNAVLIEHHGPSGRRGDPDRQRPVHGNPPTYNALRLVGATYIEYPHGPREYYDLGRDPHQLANAYELLPPQRQQQLHAAIQRAVHCHHATSCWSAQHVPG
ncbi:MAG: sulfatase-like hydrolase/transferase [Pseudonocardiaceae bacterium]|nr:sulfatase-like hydrolase/transferase [Pseudonocardiaceae bacterium]